jgi:pimeloyl-ACP methyl ester carboxylesterase
MHEYFFKERGIYYRTNEFQPGRVTLVLIHGLSGSSSAWLPLERVWEREYNVLTVDLRGHGKSLKPDRYEDYILDTIVEDIALLMDHLDVRDYIPLSQSFGVLVALKLLARRPGARAAVFMSSIYGIHGNFLTSLTRVFVHIGTAIARLFRYSARPGAHVDYDTFRHAGDWNLRRALNDIPNTTLHIWLYYLDHIYAHDLDPLWRDIRIPSLIMHGRHDTVSPIRTAYALEKAMPDATLAVIEDGSHVFPLTRVPEMERIASDFLRRFAQ